MAYVQRIKTDIGKNLETAIQSLEKKVTKVGWFAESRYPEAPHLPVAYVAATHEFGYPPKNIPPRPFMRPTVVEKENRWREIVGNGAKGVVNGKRTAIDVMDEIGSKAAGDIRKTISRIHTPPLSPKTVSARRAKRKNKRVKGLLDKPLIDTGLMYGTLTHKVENE